MPISKNKVDIGFPYFVYGTHTIYNLLCTLCWYIIEALLYNVQHRHAGAKVKGDIIAQAPTIIQ